MMHQGHMTAIAVTCLVQQECNSETLVKCFGESKSGDICDSIYRRVLRYGVSCLKIPTHILSAQYPTTLNCKNVTINLVSFLSLIDRNVLSGDLSHDWKSEK